MLATKSKKSPKPDETKLLQLSAQFDKIIRNSSSPTSTKIEQINELFAQGFTMDFEFPDGCALHKIVSFCNPFCDLEMMKFAVDSVATSFLTAQSVGGDSILHLAISNTTLDAFKYLLSKCPSSVLFSRDEVDDTPLHSAASQGETELIEVMLADLPPNEIRRLLNTRGDNEFTVIEAANANSHSKTVNFLKNWETSVTEKTETTPKATIKEVGTSTRKKAESSRRKKSIHSSKKKNQGQINIIHNFRNSKNAQLADKFLEIINDDTFSEELKINKIRNLFKEGLAKDYKFDHGKSLAHKVLLTRKPSFLSVLSYLLANESSIEVIDNRGNNLLHLCAKLSYDQEIVKYLLKSCKKDQSGNISALFAQNNIGETPLHIAAFRGDNLFITLIKKRLTPKKFIELLSAKTKEHKTALHAAITGGNQFTIRSLFSYCSGQNIDGNDDITLSKLTQETQNQKTIALITELIAKQKKPCDVHQESVTQSNLASPLIPPTNSRDKITDSTKVKKQRKKKHCNKSIRDENLQSKKKRKKHRSKIKAKVDSAPSLENNTFELTESTVNSLSSLSEVQDEEKLQSTLSEDSECENQFDSIQKGSPATTTSSHFNRSRYAFFSSLPDEEDTKISEEDLQPDEPETKIFEKDLQMVATLSQDLALMSSEINKSARSTWEKIKEKMCVLSLLPQEYSLDTIKEKESHTLEEKIFLLFHLLAEHSIQEDTFSNEKNPLFEEVLRAENNASIQECLFPKNNTQFSL